MKKKNIFKRLYKDYTKAHLKRIILSAFFSVLVAGSTSSIAWLLDPAIKKIFIERDQSLILIIPLLIVVAFATKGVSLYIAKSLMIQVGEEISKVLQFDMMKSLIKADTNDIDKKHSGKFISNLTYDVSHITNLLSNAILILFTLSNINWSITCNVYSELETCFNFNNNDTNSKFICKNSWKEDG